MSTIVSNPYEFTVLNSCKFNHYYSDRSELKIESYLPQQLIYKITIPEDVFLLEVASQDSILPGQIINFVKVTPGAVYYLESYKKYDNNGYINYTIYDNSNDIYWFKYDSGNTSSENINIILSDPSNFLKPLYSLNVIPTIYDEITSTTQSLDDDSTSEAVTTPPPI